MILLYAEDLDQIFNTEDKTILVKANETVMIAGDAISIATLKVLEKTGIPYSVMEMLGDNSRRDTELYLLGTLSLTEESLKVFPAPDAKTIQDAEKVGIQISALRQTAETKEKKKTAAEKKKELILKMISLPNESSEGSVKEAIEETDDIQPPKKRRRLTGTLKTALTEANLSDGELSIVRARIDEIEKSIQMASDPVIGLPTLIRCYLGPYLTEESIDRMIKALQNHYEELKK